MSCIQRDLPIVVFVLALAVLLATIGCLAPLAKPVASEADTQIASPGSHTDVANTEEFPEATAPDRIIDWDEWFRPPPPECAQPRFACEATDIDLGELWATGWQSVRAWHFRNEGRGPLRVRIRHTCNTNPVGSPGIVIPPGGGRTVELNVLVDGRSGRRAVFCPEAWTNDPSARRVKLQASCRVLDAVHLEPPYVRIDGIAPDTDTVSETVTITRADGGTIRPQVIAVETLAAAEAAHADGEQTWIAVSRDRMDASLVEVRPGECYHLTLTVRTGWLGKDWTIARVRLATNVPEIPERTIDVALQAAERA